jgi:membrane protease YdiL (CAAX protease family)
MLSGTFDNLKTSVSQHFSWRLFFMLWGLGVFGLFAILPYDLSLQKGALQLNQLALPLPVILIIQASIQILILALLTWIGLWLADALGLGAPKLEAWLCGNFSIREYSTSIILIVLLGLAVSALILFLDSTVLIPLIRNGLTESGQNLSSIPNPPFWQGLLASFYGGATEEILLRLFLMTLLAWIGNKLFQPNKQSPAAGLMWAAIILSSLVFGLAHLPTALAMGLPMTPLVIARTLLLNGFPGLVYGWLYWKLGLGSAMLAHFSGDILLHAIAPLLALL